MADEATPFQAGFVALIGYPNAGKSTLMNLIIGEKLSIMTPKPQTTRHQLLGIYTDEHSQILFLDTPGVLEPRYHLQRSMMKAVDRAREQADVLVYLADATRKHTFTELPEWLGDTRKPIILAVNKIDQAEPKTMAQLKVLEQKYDWDEIHQISAITSEGVNELLESIRKQLPESPQLYPEDMISEKPIRFFVSEMIREQLFLKYEEEIPYSTAVEITSYQEGEELDHIYANIVVNKASQKGIIIGKGGQAIKKLGERAREQIEAFLQKQVYLELFVKVRPNWRNKKQMVNSFGYEKT